MPVCLRVMWISALKENLKAFQQKRKHSDKDFCGGNNCQQQIPR